MKTILPLLLLSVLMVSCKEEKQPLPEAYTTKKLDTVKYEYRAINHKEYPFGKEYRFGDTLVNLSNRENEYAEHIYIHNTTYSYAYDKATFLLKSEGKSLSSSPLYFKEYDKQGKLIGQTDYLQGYTFNLDQLASKMKNDYNVDINNPEKLDIILQKNFWGTPYYGVRIIGFGNDYREIRINGKTGEFMGEAKGYYEE